MISDATVCLDANGLPYIPGSSLAGVLRQGVDKENGDKVFGDKNGSNIIVSDACLIYEDGKVAEGIISRKTPILSLYEDLPVRQHVRIGHRGVSEKGGKFDEMVVFAGSRFCSEMEYLSEDEGMDTMKNLAQQLYSESFRIGGGSRRGFGVITVNSFHLASLSLEKDMDMDLYLSKSSSLNDTALTGKWEPFVQEETKDGQSLWSSYKIELQPQDLFLFSSGLGNDETDITPTYETILTWEGNNPHIKERITLIPASSIKGALAHRTAFHYNRIKKLYADKIKDMSTVVGSNNPAVKALFGSADEDSTRGNVLLSDIYVEGTSQKKLDHVVIDSFTGGSLDGGLFNETVTYCSSSFNLDIKVNNKAFEDEDIKSAFKAALDDLCKGFLPLGGGVNRGHGIFNGKKKSSHESI